MQAGQFAAFWRRQGYRVLETSQCHWYNAKPLLFMSIPYHRLITPGPGELAEVLLRGPAAALRFEGPETGVVGTGGVFVCGDRNYDVSTLHRKARNQTRRGLESCQVERVDFGYLAEHARELNVETLARQRRDPGAARDSLWRRYCAAAAEESDFEAWAAFVEGRLAAFMVAALVEDHFSILHQSSATAYLPHYPNNALVFSVTRLQLSRAEVGCVSYGLKSLDDTSGVDHFKLAMGFRLLPARETIVLNPLLKVALTFGGARAVGWMARRRPESDLWRKVSSVIQRTAPC